jgi:diguanylate cyclase (GGDEF)-like protein
MFKLRIAVTDPTREAAFFWKNGASIVKSKVALYLCRHWGKKLEVICAGKGKAVTGCKAQVVAVTPIPVPTPRHVMIPQHCQRRSKFTDYYEDSREKVRKMGISPALIEALQEYGLLAPDNVTGFNEGRFGKGRFLTLERAIQHVKRTGEQAFYIEMDLENLSGLNSKFGHTKANDIYAVIAAIIQQELSAVASEATFFRHGGDEMSAFLVNTTEEVVREALAAVQTSVQSLARSRNLETLSHPKHPNDVRWKGIGVHFGICQLTVQHEEDPTLVFTAADTELERRKTGSLRLAL